MSFRSRSRSAALEPVGRRLERVRSPRLDVRAGDAHRRGATRPRSRRRAPRPQPRRSTSASRTCRGSRVDVGELGELVGVAQARRPGRADRSRQGPQDVVLGATGRSRRPAAGGSRSRPRSGRRQRARAPARTSSAGTTARSRRRDAGPPRRRGRTRHRSGWARCRASRRGCRRRSRSVVLTTRERLAGGEGQDARPTAQDGHGAPRCLELDSAMLGRARRHAGRGRPAQSSRPLP